VSNQKQPLIDPILNKDYQPLLDHTLNRNP